MNTKELDACTREGALYDKLGHGVVRCTSCAHGCVMNDGKRGKCGVRFNSGGRLLAPYGYVAGMACDPVEKKPFFHLLPGAGALSFGMIGCNFNCSFCQNYSTSQLGEAGPVPVRPISCGEIVKAALGCGARLVVSTYNEPLITSEWAADIFRQAKLSGLKCAYVSNGYASQRVLEYLGGVLDACKIDLKCFDEAKYKNTMGGNLKPVLDAIIKLKAMGVWVEVVTLVVPGLNDSPRELEAMAGFIASVSRDIPWHVTAFHPDYKMVDRDCTPAHSLARAAKAGKEKGLRFVYAGNVEHDELENTYCPACRALLVKRRGYKVLENRIEAGRDGTGKCGCGAAIPGIWG